MEELKVGEAATPVGFLLCSTKKRRVTPVFSIHVSNDASKCFHFVSTPERGEQGNKTSAPVFGDY